MVATSTITLRNCSWFSDCIHRRPSQIFKCIYNAKPSTIYFILYNNLTFVCIFIGCWPWSSYLKDTSNPRDDVKSTRYHVSGLVFQAVCFSHAFSRNPMKAGAVHCLAALAISNTLRSCWSLYSTRRARCSLSMAKSFFSNGEFRSLSSQLSPLFFSAS